MPVVRSSSAIPADPRPRRSRRAGRTASRWEARRCTPTAVRESEDVAGAPTSVTVRTSPAIRRSSADAVRARRRLLRSGLRSSISRSTSAGSRSRRSQTLDAVERPRAFAARGSELIATALTCSDAAWCQSRRSAGRKPSLVGDQVVDADRRRGQDERAVGRGARARQRGVAEVVEDDERARDRLSRWRTTPEIGGAGDASTGEGAGAAMAIRRRCTAARTTRTLAIGAVSYAGPEGPARSIGFRDVNCHRIGTPERGRRRGEPLSARASDDSRCRNASEPRNRSSSARRLLARSVDLASPGKRPFRTWPAIDGFSLSRRTEYAYQASP